MKLQIIIAMFVAGSLKINAQIAISYFPFENVFSFATNTESAFWGDYKLEVNTFFSNLNMELSPKCNISRKARLSYYVGPGVAFNPVNKATDIPLINGFFFDVGVRAKPLSENTNLQIAFELSPYMNTEFRGAGNLRARLGISYNFIR